MHWRNEILFAILMAILGPVYNICNNFGNVRLKKADPSRMTGVFCSGDATHSRFPLHKKHLPFANKVIGIYRVSIYESYVCYFQEVESEMIAVNLMTGGTFYTVGQ